MRHFTYAISWRLEPSHCQVSRRFSFTIDQSLRVWTRAFKRLACSEYIPLASLDLTRHQDMNEAKRFATRLERLQYHIASGSDEIWAVQHYNLVHQLKHPSDTPVLLPKRCSHPILLPGGRYLLTSGLNSDDYLRVSLWDLWAENEMNDELYAVASVVLDEVKCMSNYPVVSLNVQSDPESNNAIVVVTYLHNLMWVILHLS